MYTYNKKVVILYKVTIFIVVRIEIKFWYKIINNFWHSMFCLNVYIRLFL